MSENFTLEATPSYPYVHRDISWLSFNYRVLQEARDVRVPLMERIKFLAIYSSNLDEFFRVRVANHRNILRAGKKPRTSLDYDPYEVLLQIRSILDEQLLEFSDIFENQIEPELKKEKIYIRKPHDINKEKCRYIEKYFLENCLPFVQPVLLMKDKIKPFLNNASLYLTLQLRDKTPGPNRLQYAIVEIPSDHLPRFVELPSNGTKRHVMLLDDLVRHNIPMLFPGYEIESSYSIKLTRDAELYIDDEYSGDLVAKIKKGLGKRHVGLASRLVYDRRMPPEMLQFLIEQFELVELDCIAEGTYHNNFDFFSFPTFDLTHLSNVPLPALGHNSLSNGKSFYEISKSDLLFMFPYHSYQPVVDFFAQAARDPLVNHIKIMQYRIGKISRILESLVEAVRHGKQVSVFIEIKARFDEEENLRWAETLEANGIQVHYSLPGLKVHSKLAIIQRVEQGRGVNYAYLSTGNFNEKTAQLYSDFGFFTRDERITSEVMRLFTFVETKIRPEQTFEHLLVGDFGLRERLEAMIDFEIQEAQQGRKAAIKLKMNNLQDADMIQKLYQASQAGVEITMIIRSVCSLVSGFPSYSENIKTISILDRYLEHARIYKFHAGGEDKVYLSSADWMSRNLSRRIEAAFPILDPKIKKTIQDIFEIQMSDNVKARSLDYGQENQYQKTKKEIAHQSQLETYYYFKRNATVGV